MLQDKISLMNKEKAELFLNSLLFRSNLPLYKLQWEDGISQLFEDIVAQVVVEYCQENENENCLHSKLRKR